MLDLDGSLSIFLMKFEIEFGRGVDPPPDFKSFNILNEIQMQISDRKLPRINIEAFNILNEIHVF